MASKRPKSPAPRPGTMAVAELLEPIPVKDPTMHDGSLDGTSHRVLPKDLKILEQYRGDISSITSLVGILTRREFSSWAILVVSFHDDPAPSPSLTGYQNVFTGAGAGTMNVVDYFEDVSHGKLDQSGSTVFGPYVLDRPRTDYVGNVYPQPDGKLNRNGLLDLAKATATTNGVDLSKFAGVVVCGTPSLDLCGWTGGFAALCDDASIQPSLLGQEMGHGYGLDHSRLNGSDADYQDMWDTMSTANAWMANHPTYGAVGPGLNAWNMRLRGWLNEKRVLAVSDDVSSEQTVTLRPLHARGLPGMLAIDVGGYLVEFRHRSRWDAGIPRSCVLVHRAESNRSYLMQGTSGNPDLVAGDHFQIGREGGLLGKFINVEVGSIDEDGQSATLRVTHDPLRLPHIPEVAGTVFGGVAVDGGGFIFVNGKVFKIPPRGPARELVESVTRLLEAGEESDRAGEPALRERALNDVVLGVGSLSRDIELVTDSPPGMERLRRR